MKRNYSLLAAFLFAGSVSGFLTSKVQADETDPNQDATKNGFVTENGLTVYYQDGSLVHGQKKINGKWYLFDEQTGAMKTGFQKLTSPQKKTVYYDAKGRMLYGKHKISGHWYWFENKSGKMKTGFQTVAKTSYKAAYKWVKKGGKVFKKKYKKKTTSKYKLYYAANGQLQYGERKIKGKWYYFNKKNAHMTTGLQMVGKSKKYYAANGQRKTGYQKIKGRGYYFDKKNGTMYVKKFVLISGRDYYALSNGVLHAPTWHSQFTPIWAPEGCAVASSATLLSIKNRSFNMQYAYSNLPQVGSVFSTANFGGLLAASTLTSYMKRFDSGFTNITGNSVSRIKSIVKSGHPVLYYGFSSYEIRFYRKQHAKVIVGYQNGRFLIYDPCYYSAGSGSSYRNAYDYGARAWVSVGTFTRESTGGSNNGAIMMN